MLVEREPHLSVLGDALRRVVGTRRGEVVVVEGPAGVGKTSVLSVLRDRAAGAGATVLAARGAELEAGVAFGLARELLGVAPGPRPVARGGPDATSGIDQRLDAMQALHRRVVERVAADGPLVLVVDDAHAADVGSLEALGYVARRLDDVAVLLVVASRPREAEDGAAGVELSRLAAHPGAHDVRLEPLTVHGSAAVLRSATGDALGPEVVAACHAATGGNPFLLGELARELRRQGTPPTLQAVADLTATAPAGLVRRVGARIGVLSPDATTLVRALVVLGDEPRPEVVVAASQVPAERLSAAVRVLTGIGVLAPGTLAFCHPLLRAAVDADLDPVGRALLHERAYVARHARGDDPERLAVHLVHAAPRQDPERVRVLAEAAALSSADGAHDVAAARLARALLEPPPASERPALLLALGSVELAAGRAVEAADHLRAALPGLAGADLVRATTLLARALVEAGEPEAAIDVLDGAREGWDEETALLLDVERTTIALYVPDLAVEAQVRMRAYAGLPGRTPGERVALANAALAEAFSPRGTCADATRLAKRALAGGLLIDEAGAGSPTTGQAMYALIFGAELETVERLVDRMLTDAERRRSTLGAAAAWLGVLQVDLLRGDVRKAGEAGRAGLELLGDVPRSPIAARWRVGLVRFTAEALVEAGELTAADALLDDAAAGSDLDAPENVLLRFARGLHAAARGDHERAAAEFVAYGRVAARVGYEERTTPWRLEAALSARALGDVDGARAMSRESLDLATTWGFDAARGAALRVDALVGPHRFRTERLQQAEELLRPGPYRLAHARVLLDLGRAAATAGSQARAHELLVASLDRAAAGGAMRVRDQAHAALLELGRRPRRDRATGAEALTPAERRVADLAAAGLSNRDVAGRLFVSPRTVESQLTSIFRKLDVHGRAELRAALELEEPAPAAQGSPGA